MWNCYILCFVFCPTCTKSHQNRPCPFVCHSLWHTLVTCTLYSAPKKTLNNQNLAERTLTNQYGLQKSFVHCPIISALQNCATLTIQSLAKRALPNQFPLKGALIIFKRQTVTFEADTGQSVPFKSDKGQSVPCNVACKRDSDQFDYWQFVSLHPAIETFTNRCPEKLCYKRGIVPSVSCKRGIGQPVTCPSVPF